MRRLLCLILSAVMCLNLTGCYDSKEISRIAFIIAVGFDTDSYTFQIVKPSAFEGEGSEDSPLFTTTLTAPDVYIAMDKLNSTISEQCDYSHIKIVLFSQEKLKKGIEDEVRAMLKSNDFHPNTHVAMCIGDTSEYLKDMEIPLDANPAEYYENIFKKDFTEYSPDTKLKDMEKNYNTQAIANVIPVLDKKIQGMAVVRDYKLSDLARGQDVLLYHILKENDFRGNYSVDDKTVISLNKKNCKYRVDTNSNPPVIYVKASFDANIIWSEADEDKEKIQEAAKKKLESELTELLYRCSMYYKADIFEFCKLAKTGYLTIKSWEDEDWQGIYEKAGYNVTADISISREGLNIK